MLASNVNLFNTMKSFESLDEHTLACRRLKVSTTYAVEQSSFGTNCLHLPRASGDGIA